jgi:hypothetical protein
VASGIRVERTSSRSTLEKEITDATAETGHGPFSRRPIFSPLLLYSQEK